ncbi:MAG TPA: Swt1 family HEPN domain-containing protein [Steroidobacter sp.]|uniref:Swt1 family HEPN domain-containing protein n=1 Tax=Steroidobacter sp. TaxID=1978227 RepID=UPI002ED9473E
MSGQLDLYSFVYRGVLAEESLRRSIPSSDNDPNEPEEDVRRRMPLESIDDGLVLAARKMAWIYVAIAAFENSVRVFVGERLLEKVGEDWWDSVVSNEIRTQAEKRKKDEEQIRWHGARGTSPLSYVQLGDLASIIQNNHIAFKELIPSVEWAREIFRSLERSRNVIMHSGQLKMGDVERVAMNIRDWLRQVGG